MQSALLEVMAERKISIGGKTYPLPKPFLVMATQNPIENEGVYPLPEAQRDRFLFKINVDYPSPEEEREIIYRMGVSPPEPKQILETGDLLRLQDVAANNFVHHALVDYVVRVVTATRRPEQFGMPDVKSWIAFGASPRASLGIIAASRALALVRGRDYVVPQDVIEVIPDVLRHRLVLTYDALADDVKAETVINRILQTVALPQVNADSAAGPLGAAGGACRGRRQRSVSESTPAVDAAGQPQAVHPPSFQRGEIGDAKLSAALRTLELTVKRKLDGVLQGNHLGLIPGPGSEPGESRLYQPGDDVRRMDWSVTARTTHPHVRQMIADRELETWMVVDMSASLDFGTTGCEKRDLAVAAAAAITYLNSGGGNRIGAVIANGENVIRVPARSGRQHEQTLLRAIATSPRAPLGVRGDLAAAIDALRRPERRRGMAVIISDFLGPINWMRPLRAIAARHEVLGHRGARPPRCGTARRRRRDPAGHRIRGHPRVHHRRPTARRLRPGRGRPPRGGGADPAPLRGTADDAAHRPRLDRRHRALRRLPAPRRHGGQCSERIRGRPMTLPLLGPMALTNFAHPWFFLFLLLVAGLVALYVITAILPAEAHPAVRQHGTAGKRCPATALTAGATCPPSC